MRAPASVPANTTLSAAPGAFHQAEAVTMGDKDHEAFVIRRSLASIVSENAYSVDGIVAAVSPS